MKKFKVTAIRTDEYIIELDETKFDEKWAEDFAKVFHPIDEIQDVVKDLAFHQLRFGSNRFVEGYGNVLRNNQLPYSRSDYDVNGKLLPEEKRDKPAEGINIVIESEDTDYEFEIEEEAQ
jgi:hypothetical protein